MKLINKEKVAAEIEKRMKHNKEWLNWCKENRTSIIAACQAIQEDKDIISLIDTFEIKEVDLKKEYDNKFFKDPVFGKLVNRNAGISIAKHFLELGLKVQKGGI